MDYNPVNESVTYVSRGPNYLSTQDQRPAGEMATSNESPSAPPLEQLEIPAGYEQATFTPLPLHPPQLPDSDGSNFVPIQREIPNLANVTEEEVKSALHDFVSENCCYGFQPIEKMHVRDILMNSAFHYKLETFTEKRQTAWTYEPFKGQPIDGPQNGRPPAPWEIAMVPERAFAKSQKTIEVPHTASVRVCHSCTGNGKIRCRHCSGFGGTNCSWCHGSGRRTESTVQDNQTRRREEMCVHCMSSGRQRCYHCHGHGQVKCPTCKGCGQLKCSLALTTSWHIYMDEYISDQTGLADSLIRQVTGTVAFDERYPRLYPLINFPDRRVVDASKGLIQRHSTAFPMERILEQRHHVRMVPVGIVTYYHEQREGSFYVYGLEHKIYFPNYPARCCCGYCAIL